jgi:REP element-mobilizing transposase RayT
MPYSELLRGRASLSGQIYLVTTVTSGRARLFTNLYLGRIVVRELHAPAMTACARTLAYVVMPDHLHWLLQLQSGSNLSEVVWALKGRSSFAINRAREVRGCVWQQQFHDRALRSDEHLGAVARYVVCNPVRAGLVRRVHDYSLWDCVWVGGESG